MIAAGELVLDLYPAMVAVYLLDCVVRVGTSAVLLSRRFGRGRVLRGPRFFFAGVLPSDRAYSVAPDTLALTGRGIFVLSRDDTAAARYRSESYDYTPYEETAWTLDRAALRKQKTVVAAFANPHHAQLFAAFKRRLTESDPVERRRLIAAAGAAAHRRVEEARDRLAPLLRLTQLSSFVLLATLFLVLPGLALQGPDAEPAVRAAALLAAALYLSSVILSAWAIRSMRRIGIEPPHALLLAAFLFPLGAAHASYHLTRTLAASLDSLSAAALLLPRDDFALLARTEAYGIDLAMTSGRDPAWTELWEDRRASLAALLRRSGLSEAAVRQPPPSDATARHWCPFCAAEYAASGDLCAHCETPLVDLG